MWAWGSTQWGGAKPGCPPRGSHENEQKGSREVPDPFGDHLLGLTSQRSHRLPTAPSPVPSLHHGASGDSSRYSRNEPQYARLFPALCFADTRVLRRKYRDREREAHPWWQGMDRAGALESWSLLSLWPLNLRALISKPAHKPASEGSRQ